MNTPYPQSDEPITETDQYGNPLGGNTITFCCFPDCGCDGAIHCCAEQGASYAAMSLNRERGTFNEIQPKPLGYFMEHQRSIDVEQEILNAELDEADTAITPIEAALDLAMRYGGINGEHHKTWVIDQMVRALTGTDYANWVQESKVGEDGPNTYTWDEGIAP